MLSKISLSSKLYYKYRTLEHKFNQYRNNTGETTIAETEYGKIKGVKRKSLYNIDYYSFEKIPFAEPPLGNLRFKAPKPPKPWNGVLDCTKMNSKPMQINLIYGYVEGTEDCLYLNVYTNDLKPEKPRAVMVWIYGGGFILGEATREFYSPELLITKDIVLVTVNYRVNALGFLSLEDPKADVPGNAGLKDQVMALKWVKNNCSQFGGDPNNITVFGESAGAASAHYMSITEQTKGLFQRVILMSGNAIAPWGLVKQNHYAYRLAKHCGYSGEDNDNDVLQYLRGVKASDLVVDDTKILTSEEQLNGILFCFGPTVEPYDSKDCVVPKEPAEMMKTAWTNSIPMVTGFTSSEGLLFHATLSKDPNALQLLETCAYLVPSELVDDRESKKCLELGKKIKDAHVHQDSTPLNCLLDILGFKHFVHPNHQVLASRAKYSLAPTFLYRYDFDSDNLYVPFRIGRQKGLRGSSHADDLAYLFHSITGRKMNKNSREYKTIDRMTSWVTQFAISSDPNCEALQSVKWKPLEKDNTDLKCLNISDEVKIIDLPEKEKLKVWDSLYAQCTCKMH